MNLTWDLTKRESLTLYYYSAEELGRLARWLKNFLSALLSFVFMAGVTIYIEHGFIFFLL